MRFKRPTESTHIWDAWPDCEVREWLQASSERPRAMSNSIAILISKPSQRAAPWSGAASNNH